MPQIFEREITDEDRQASAMIGPAAERMVRVVEDDGRTTVTIYDADGDPLATVEGTAEP